MRIVRLVLILTIILAATAACGAPTASAPIDAATAPAAPTTVAPAASAYPSPDSAHPADATSYPAPESDAPAPTNGSQAALEATVVPDAVISIIIVEHQVQADVVATPEKRNIGLMFRDALPDDRGMLFVFAGAYTGGFWMRNTRIPLSIAFIGEDRRILNIEDMQPLDEINQHYPAGAAYYALEVNQGWFGERNIQPGDMVEFELPADLSIR